MTKKQRTIKRIIDIVIASVAIVILSPIMIIVSICIYLYDKGPIFADIPKRGNDLNKLFKLLKFRSMIQDADNKLRNDPKYKKFFRLYKNKDISFMNTKILE